jgi:hypothetical protein
MPMLCLVSPPVCELVAVDVYAVHFEGVVGIVVLGHGSR